ncbi:DUF2000 domain-containing protein [Variovorax sp. IB41]|jgi:hypothetical protein|uniref:DUF2000 domain-containing protein n=1 Tax=Variovorax sp. IB41 TaxID=2779370 RepID=UPI0018E7AFE1|nr:DUF2000 domain-containing protein [Variovorax sp. IB41]MBJ2154894.1 DUF2000 domain-containing protein [Variovorax sp. IB41]
MPEASASAAPDKVAIVLAEGLTPGPAANIASCIAAGLAASSPGWAGQSLMDAAGLQSAAPSHLPIAILRAEAATMHALTQRLAAGAIAEGGALSLFPAYAQAIHECGEYWHRHGLSAHADETMLGIGLAGPRRWVNRMTGNLALWR